MVPGRRFVWRICQHGVEWLVWCPKASIQASRKHVVKRRWDKRDEFRSQKPQRCKNQLCGLVRRGLENIFGAGSGGGWFSLAEQGAVAGIGQGRFCATLEKFAATGTIFPAAHQAGEVIHPYGDDVLWLRDRRF